MNKIVNFLGKGFKLVYIEIKYDLNMKLTFYGGAGEVGRSCILVGGSSSKVLLDAGINVAGKGKDKFPLIPESEFRKLDAVVIGHAHIDHSGYVPYLVKKGFRGNIYITKPSRDIMHLLLSDAVKIAKFNKEVIYNEDDVTRTMKQVEVLEYNAGKEIAKGVVIKFLNAGHIIGSAQVLLEIDGKKLLYSGDINSRDSVMLPQADSVKERVDLLIVEGTYGKKDALLESLKKVSKQLADIIKDTFKKGGMVVVPVFAIGRGQEIMLALENYIRSGYLPEMTIFVDGMVGKANRICRHNVIYMRDEIPNRILLADDDPFKSPYLKVPERKDRKDVFQAKNAVVLATSGMCTAGPVLNYLKKVLERGENAVVIVGYQAEGTLGRKLQEGAKEVEIDGRKYRVNARVETVHFSGHADFNGLRNYAKDVNCKNVVIMHTEGAEDLERALKKAGHKVRVPENLQEIEIT